MRSARTVFQKIDEASAPGSDFSAFMVPLFTLARYSPGPIVECGVFKGYTTFALLHGAIEAGLRLTSYDTMPATRTWAEALIAPSIPLGDDRWKNWTFVQKRSVHAAGDWADGSVGLFFLDTTHKYADTKEELDAWLPKMRPDGIICGHDYLNSHDSYGVKRALEEFAPKHEARFQFQAIKQDRGFFILWPK